MGGFTSKKGFTLIELIVVLAILSILAAILVPIIFGFIEQTRMTADQATVRTLNSITPLYRLSVSSDDPFKDAIKSNVQLMEALVEGGYLAAVVEPQNKEAAFIWNMDRQFWVYHIPDSADNFYLYYLLSKSDYEEGWGPHVIGKFTNMTEKNIQLPEGIQSIQGGLSTAAFFEKGLESVVLPDSLKNLYSHAFYGNNLKEIVIPSSVTFIGTMSFYNNPITKVTMLNEPGQVVIQDRAFGSGYTESKIVTDSFKAAYSSGGPGTYEWTNGMWVKTN